MGSYSIIAIIDILIRGLFTLFSLIIEALCSLVGSLPNEFDRWAGESLKYVCLILKVKFKCDYLLSELKLLCIQELYEFLVLDRYFCYVSNLLKCSFI